MNQLSVLKTYLLASIRRNGNQPLTLAHLVNIIGVIECEELHKELELEKDLNEVLQDNLRYGNDSNDE